MIAPLLTFALQAATYQAGIPTHNYKKTEESQQWAAKLFNNKICARATLNLDVRVFIERNVLQLKGCLALKWISAI